MQITKRFSFIVLCAPFLLASAESFAANEERSFSVQPGGRLELSSDVGGIRVDTHNENTVNVLVIGADDLELEFAQRGNDVVVTAESESSFFGWSMGRVEFQILVPVQYDLDLRTGGGNVRINDVNGEISARTSGGNVRLANTVSERVVLHTSGGNIEADSVQGDAEVHTSGGHITMGPVAGRLDVNTSGGNIELTSVGGDADVRTSGGSIRVDSAGGDLNVHTSGGNIRVGAIAGRGDLDTSGGRIEAGMAQGPIEVRTSGGSIDLDGSAVSVVADTAGGNIEIRHSGGYVEADTSGGNITIGSVVGYIEAETSGGSIDATLVAGTGGDQHVRMSSSGGEINLRLPANHAATIDAELRLTRSRGDYRIYTDFPLVVNDESGRRITAEGDINGGGSRIELHTTNGDINIMEVLQ